MRPHANFKKWIWTVFFLALLSPIGLILLWTYGHAELSFRNAPPGLYWLQEAQYDVGCCLAPADSEWARRRANWMLTGGNIEGAKTECERALSLADNKTSCYLLLGQISMHTGDFTRSRSALDQAIAGNANQPVHAAEAYMSRGQLLQQQRQYKLASADFNRAVDLTSGSDREACRWLKSQTTFLMALNSVMLPRKHTTLTLPISFNGSHIYSSAKLNKQNLKLIIDTGVSLPLISAATARVCKLAPIADIELPCNNFGEVDFVRPTTIAELTLGDMRLVNVPGTIANSVFSEQGAIGGVIFERLVLTLDYRMQTLTFARSTPRMKPGTIAIPIVLINSIPHVRGTANGKDLGLFTVDTGSHDSIIRIDKVDVDPYYTNVNKSLSGSTFLSGPTVLHKFAIGNFDIGDLQVNVVNNRGTGTLGNDFLSQYRVTIDYINKNLFLQPR